MANKLAPESFDFLEGAAPSTPDPGHVRIYSKTDGNMYQKDDTGTESQLGGGGTMSSFDVTADTGTPETVADGNTLTVAGGTGIDTSVAATDTVSIAIDSTVATLADAQTLTNKTIDANNNTITNIGSSEIVSDIITGQTADASPTAGTDYVLTYKSATGLRKVLLSDLPGGGGGGAPTGATYITQTSNGSLTNEQALSLLATGIMKNTTATGVVSIAVEGTDYYAPGGTDVAVADGGTGRSSATAYAVVCGGTTSTGALQSIASVGTSGQVLTSNGAGALPTFQSAGGGGGYDLAAWNATDITSDFTTTSASYVDVTNSTYNGFSPTSSTLLVRATFVMTGNSAPTRYARLNVDGNAGSNIEFLSGSNSYTLTILEKFTGITTGSAIDIKLQVQSNGSATLRIPSVVPIVYEVWE